MVSGPGCCVSPRNSERLLSHKKENLVEKECIRRIRERLAYGESENPWVRLYFDDVMKPGGPGRYNRVVEGGDGTGPGVVIVPVTTSQRIVFVRVFRYPVSRWLTELPRGFGEPGLDGASNASKELLEETGLRSESVALLGRIYPNTGLLATEVQVFRADAVAEASAKPCLSECISEVLFLSREQIERCIRQGDIADGITLSALSMCWLSG